MLSTLSKFKPILLGLLGLVLLYLVYVVSTGVDVVGGGKNDAASIAASTQEIETELLMQLDRLSRVQLDEQLFAHETYKALQDHSKPLEQPVLGRPDPFAPLVGR